MKTSEAIGIGVLAYLIYRLTSKRDQIPPQKTVEPTQEIPDQKFQTLKQETQSALLRNYSQDYVAKKDVPEKDYPKVLEAANETGAPIAWVQEVYRVNPQATVKELVSASENMLTTCDKYISCGCDSLDTVRELSILSGAENLSGQWHMV